MTPRPIIFAMLMVVAGCGAPTESHPVNDNAQDNASPSATTQAPIFVDVARAAGLDFEHFIGATGQFYFTEVMGAGVALLDYDLDGDLDVYLVQGSMLGDTSATPLFPAPQTHWPGNRLFRNELVERGELRFSDVTPDAGVGDTGYGMGVAVGDVDDDGDPDLYVSNFGANVFYRNLGDGRFEAVPDAGGANDARWTTSASFLDYDNDGDLDLFVTSYTSFSLLNHKQCRSSDGERDYCAPQSYEALTDRLYRNDGDFRFTDVSRESGILSATGTGLGVTGADFNGDSIMDIYVANDGWANFLWLGDGQGGFEENGMMSGTAYNSHGLEEASMGVTAGDFDGDGDEDLFMTHLAQQTNTLYVNDGTGQFIDATDRYNMGGSSLPYTGFGTAWFDFDNDGHLDLFIANGAVARIKSLVGASPYPYAETNQLYRNLGTRRFEDVTAIAGPVFAAREVSRGAAFGDLDNDGDLDIVVANNNGPVRLLRNEVGNRHHWVQVSARGMASNRDGIGARVAVLRAGAAPLWRRVHTDGSYLSASDDRVHVGLGDSDSFEGVGIQWPSGRREVWRDLGVDQHVTLEEGTGQPWPPASTR